jgi:hypothetical protein
MDDVRDVTRPPGARAAGGGVPLRLPVRDIRAGPSFRAGSLDRDHVAALALLRGSWPPILIDRDRVVIDGAHRLQAAILCGLEDLACEVFDGTPEDAFVEFVSRNTHHGLPLTLHERRAAASRIIGSREQWSDRRIAEVCGVAPGTVASLRKAGVSPGARPTDHDEQSDRRVGRDGRSRPVSSHAIAERVIEAIRRDPHASLRTIAGPIGVSPETVRRVKARMRRVAMSGPGGQADGAQPVSSPLAAPVADDPEAPGEPWSGDQALQSMPDGCAFLDWFGRTSIGDEWRWLAASVPVSRIYMVADESRRRAALWRHFADAVESRIALQHASSG